MMRLGCSESRKGGGGGRNEGGGVLKEGALGATISQFSARILGIQHSQTHLLYRDAAQASGQLAPPTVVTTSSEEGGTVLTTVVTTETLVQVRRRPSRIQRSGAATLAQTRGHR